MLPGCFFDSSTLKTQVLASDDVAVTLLVQSVAAAACCPRCGYASGRVHSRYRRRLLDLPWLGKPVRIHLTVRRFFCQDPDCSRQIFAERLPTLSMAHARTTLRLRESHCRIGLALGGEAGARLATRLSMPTSADTLLRRIRSAPLPPAAAVRVLGVDDWAFRKGHHYGTFLCDLERRRPVDLLPERSAEALATWLKDHPEVAIISRDRADDYIRGATQGAPQATQVADRWHLLRNLRDAVTSAVDRHRTTVRDAAQEAANVSAPAPVPQAALPSGDPSLTTATMGPSEASRSARLERYEQVIDLHRQGMSQRAIAERVGLYRSTVIVRVDTLGMTDDQFAKWLRTIDPRFGLPGGWNLYGNGHCRFVTAACQAAVTDCRATPPERRWPAITRVRDIPAEWVAREAMFPWQTECGRSREAVPEAGRSLRSEGNQNQGVMKCATSFHSS